MEEETRVLRANAGIFVGRSVFSTLQWSFARSESAIYFSEERAPVDQTPNQTPGTPGTPENAPEPIPFDPAAPHHTTPKVRAIQGFPVKQGEQVMLGLTDPRKIASRVVFTSPAVQHLLPLLNGTRKIDAIVDEIGRGLTREMVETLVSQLDGAGLLEGPNFEKLYQEMKDEFDGSNILPPAATAMFADALVMQELGDGATPAQKKKKGGEKLGESFDAWIEQSLKSVDDPSLNKLPRAIFAPHLDYPRGWHNYSQIYGRLRVVDRPARIVILGTNHFGMGSGVVGCDKGYETPIGTCPLDEDFLALLKQNLGEENTGKLFENRYDHEREHSIELHIPWIQHIFGPDESGNHVPVFSALVHDPVRNNGESYDGNGLALEPFLSALREAIEAVGGTTLIVSSADLSHIGKAFGDDQPLLGEDPQAEVFRNKAVAQDQELLELVRNRKADDLIASMAWQQNPTRWCSTGNIVAAMKLTDPDEVEILHYAAAIDPQGLSMVSSCAGVMR